MMIVDTHVHVYPQYEAGNVLRLCAERLHALAPDAVPVACLTERHDCHFFAELRDKGLAESSYVLGREVLEGGRSIIVRFGQGVPPLFVIPGRQIVTKDRLEVHCVGNDAAIGDGYAVDETIGRIRELDALTVLPWGVGKWLFKRLNVVNRLLKKYTPEDFLLGDSAMRPSFWPEPLPMLTGRSQGYRVLGGSDPLPHEVSGRWVGCYATKVDFPFDRDHPSRSCLCGLRLGSIARMGKRPGPLGFVVRMRG